MARYVARLPVATERLSLTESGHMRYALKTTYRDGTTHVIFEPEYFTEQPEHVVVHDSAILEKNTNPNRIN